MITFNEQNRIFRLDTPATSYAMGIVEGGYLGHLYYGPRIGGTDLEQLYRLDAAALPSAWPGQKGGFMNVFPMEFPAAGRGEFREPCIDVQMPDGRSGLELTYRTHRIYEGKKPLEGLPASWDSNPLSSGTAAALGTDTGAEESHHTCATLEIDLEDPDLKILVTLSYSVFDDLDVVTRSVRVTNEGGEPVHLTRILSASITRDIASCATDHNGPGTCAGTPALGSASGTSGEQIITMTGAWAREHIINVERVHVGSYVTESLRGEPGHAAQPFIALASADCTQNTGEVTALHLIYSGNFLGKIQNSDSDCLRMVLGIHPEHFAWKLEPGEAFQAPEAVMTFSAQGLGKMTRTLHDFYRSHLIRSPWLHKKRPVLINSWEPVYFDFNEEKLVRIAQTAAAQGIELFVLDDGWFGHRNSDNSSLGDWFVFEEKLPGGLKSLAEKINALGMQFGLWLEPEMISPDSDLFRAHPDWVLRTAKEPVQLRNQWVLDLSREDVLDYLEERLKAILHSANIAYIKWDMNRYLTDIGSAACGPDRQGELYHRHVLGLYRLQEALIREFPDLLIENCSGGGARFDPGMLYYSPQIWCSDDMDPRERARIFEGTAMIYPLSTIGMHVCGTRNDITGRITPIETRAATSLFGTFGYEVDPAKLPPEDFAKIPGQIALYHRLNDLIREGDYYRIASYRENGLFDCFMAAAKDGLHALVLYHQVIGEPARKPRILRLAGLDPERTYEVREIMREGLPADGAAQAADGAAQAAPALQLRGDTLMRAGLRMPNLRGDYPAVLIEIEAV